MKGNIIESKVTEVYVVVIEDLGIVKIGITNNFPERMHSLRSAIRKASIGIEDANITVVHRFITKVRVSALSLEKYLHKKFKNYQIQGYDFAGHTELFSKEVLEGIKGAPDVPTLGYYNPNIYCEPTDEQIAIIKKLTLSSNQGQLKKKKGVRGVKWLAGNILANYALMCKYGVDELYYSKVFLTNYLQQNTIRTMVVFTEDFTLENLNIIFPKDISNDKTITRLPKYLTPSMKDMKVMFKDYPIWEYRLSCCIGFDVK